MSTTLERERHRRLRRALLALLLAPVLARGKTPDAASGGRKFAQDFDALWNTINREYAYFGTSKAPWKRSRDLWRAKAAAARSVQEFALTVSFALSELHDDHVELELEGRAIARRVPADTDVWAEWKSGAALITAVRASSVADVAGLHPGQVVAHVQGVPIERLVDAALPTGRRDARDRDWALRRLLAGPRTGPMILGVREPQGAAKRIELHRAIEPTGHGLPLVARKIGEERDLGYIRIKNNLGESGTVMHFDAALEHLKGTRGLMIDLRETQDGGADAVVVAILGRFIEAPLPWQVRVAANKVSTTDVAAPRGAFAYRAPMVVLVDRWTAAEGEGLAAALQATGATLVGTGMAGLNGRGREVALAHSRAVVRFPAERTLTAAGQPRESLRPDVPVDLLAPSGGPADPILYQGLKTLEARKK